MPPSLTFGANNWDDEQPVRVSAQEDADAVDDTATITHTVSGGDYTTTPALTVDDVSVTVEDKEDDSTAVILTVNRDVPESSTGTVVQVTGTLNGAPKEYETVVRVTVTAGTPALDDFDATPDDFNAVSPFDLTIAADQPRGTANFTLTPVNDLMDEPDETVTVDGSATVWDGSTIVERLEVNGTPVTITDNDDPPTVTLLSADSISESGTDNSTAVTATLNHPSSEVTTVDVTAAAVPPAVDDDFTLNGMSLTILAGETESSGSVTLTARNNTEDEADKQVTVTGRAENTQGVQSTTVGPVTVTITDDDPPEVEGPEMPPIYTEGGMKEVAEYTAKDRARNEIAWAVSGPDGPLFTIPNGELRFQEAPDYEASRSNIYQVTVEASDRNLPDERPGTLEVTVTVGDALGTVRLSSNQPQVGRVLTATVSEDPDGVDTTTTEWCWERSLLPSFPPGETDKIACIFTPSMTATYTPVDDDLGHHLRATVTYTDSKGTPKREAVAAVTTETVSARPPPPPRPPSGGDPPGGGGPPSPEPDPEPEPDSEPVGVLENPGPGSRQSGLGLLSGWVCDAAVVELEINGTQRVAAAYGTDRADTASVCGDRDNGFGLLFNWNLLGDGVNTVVAVADGATFDQATFTVTTLGEEFVTDAVGETVLADFPTAGEEVRLVWQQATQNFVLAPLDGDPPPASPPGPLDGPVGALENPGPASFQSGIGLLSGWVCEANMVELEINGGPRIAAAYGTDRADTASVCGDTDNGFGLLFNWNLLGDGVQTVVAVADGAEFGRATFTVTTLGVEFLEGGQGETVVVDFPSLGEEVRLIWQQANQNFVLAPLVRDTAETTGQ